MTDFNQVLGETLTLFANPHVGRGIAKALGDALALDDDVFAPSLSRLSQAQIDKLASFRFRFPDDVHDTEAQLAALLVQRDEWQLIDDSYVSAQRELMNRLEKRLKQKAAAISTSALVHFLGSHPNLGGAVPSAWQVMEIFVVWNTGNPISVTGGGGVTSLDGLTTYLEGSNYTRELVPTIPPLDPPGPDSHTYTAIALPAQVKIALSIPIVVYSHFVEFDNDALILTLEDSWLELQNARFNTYWGSTKRLAAFALALDIQSQYLAILNGREQAAIDTLLVRKYIDWVTEAPFDTRQTQLVVTNLIESSEFTLNVHYTVTPDEEDPTVFEVAAIEDSGIAALVRVRAI